MDHLDPRDVMIKEAKRAYRRTFTQGAILASIALWLGTLALGAQNWMVAVPLFMIAGACMCSCLTRVAMIMLVHRGRVWQYSLHLYYVGCIERLYAVYGHDAADALKGMPPPPFDEQGPPS